MATFDASVVEMALIAVDVSRTARSHPLDRGEGGVLPLLFVSSVYTVRPHVIALHRAALTASATLDYQTPAVSLGRLRQFATWKMTGSATRS